ncbi:hypothetical protein GUITHDRAFT_114334 [Guillardia theta CCMP2712]|uniref:RING-type domain-containing protein n=1 Tax=Guillardia theta (strain CCMP2712) TaxID=905079 RepID=L1IUT8_GUITC|nr:hypothetical protein GUITHDRAFT_114334 [Guillardia theta CCMP2712]EKX39605.1 hypothetical protein GUITHDRAFT_114334 [Guillardia theta CCMP2712]|eukprot:XP_005826585.1 hypothetical protein GUITHDRAFT_114334 [Guillardia theta CCMP2712]
MMPDIHAMYPKIEKMLQLKMPFFLAFSVLLLVKLKDNPCYRRARCENDPITFLGVFVPLIVQQIFSIIPAMILLSQRERATLVNVVYKRIMAKNDCCNGLLRALFFILFSLRLDGVIDWWYRVIASPVWLQLVVMLIILHTAIKNLNDAMSARDFKKQSSVIELQLLCTLFISLKLDGVLEWTWSAVFWPVWLATGIFCGVALLLSILLPCMACMKLLNHGRYVNLRTYAHPVLLVAIWSFAIFAAICTSIALVHLANYLEGDSSSAYAFIAPLIVMFAYFCVIEIWVVFFSEEVINRLGTQLSNNNEIERMAEMENLEEAATAFDGEKPKILIQIGDDLYRRPFENETFDEEELCCREGYVPTKRLEDASPPEGHPCIICWEQKSETVFLECGHACCCFDCARQVIVRHQPCPMCRCQIKQCVLIDVLPSDGLEEGSRQEEARPCLNGHTRHADTLSKGAGEVTIVVVESEDVGEREEEGQENGEEERGEKNEERGTSPQEGEEEETKLTYCSVRASSDPHLTGRDERGGRSRRLEFSSDDPESSSAQLDKSETESRGRESGDSQQGAEKKLEGVECANTLSPPIKIGSRKKAARLDQVRLEEGDC